MNWWQSWTQPVWQLSQALNGLIKTNKRARTQTNKTKPPHIKSPQTKHTRPLESTNGAATAHWRWQHRQDTHTQYRSTSKTPANFIRPLQATAWMSHTSFLAWDFPLAVAGTFKLNPAAKYWTRAADWKTRVQLNVRCGGKVWKLSPKNHDILQKCFHQSQKEGTFEEVKSRVVHYC